MSYTAPDFSQILSNEQTLSTRLTNLQTLLREILDDVNVEYSSSDTVIDLIDLFIYVKTYYWQNTLITAQENEDDYGGNYYTQVVLNRLSTVIKMKNVRLGAWSNTGSSTEKGMFQLFSRPLTANTNSAAFGEFADNGKVTLLDNWSMKIAFTTRNYDSGESNFSGIGIMLSGSGDSLSDEASDYYGCFIGLVRSNGNMYPAFAYQSNSDANCIYSYDDTTAISANTIYYAELKSDYVNTKFVLTIYDENDNIVYTNEITWRSVFGSRYYNYLTTKIYFGAYSFVYTSNALANGASADFVIRDGYVDAPIGGS